MGFPLDHETPKEWVALVERDPLALLEDHAHCELKAAASAHALIAKNPDRAELVRDLADIAIEELEHFKVVVAELEARVAALRSDPFAEERAIREVLGLARPGEVVVRFGAAGGRDSKLPVQ